MKAARADVNQAQIVAALRAVGASVIHLHGVGKGCPDLLIGFNGTHLLEVKSGPKAKLTPDQVKLHARWQGDPIHIVCSPQEALTAIGLLLIDATGK